MYKYGIEMWIAFFFFYCIAGWIWESCYVSVRKRQWTNRGFLNGPWLPIYGSGAIVVLYLTIPVQNSVPLVFLVGMIAATILEYVTGDTMERLFQMRYWDYSDNFMNLNGHICLFCSLGWGFFSVMMVWVIHPPVEALISRIPAQVLSIGDAVLLGLFVVDAIISTREALDLKEIILRKAAQSEELQRLQKRLDVLAAVVDDDIDQFRSELYERAETFRDGREEEIARIRLEMKEKREDLEKYLSSRKQFALRILKRNPGSVSLRHKLNFDDIMAYLGEERRKS